jgi:glycosyltransferase involved in cell wall biosynthesis
MPRLRLADLHYFPHPPLADAEPVRGTRTSDRFWAAPWVARRNYRALQRRSEEADVWHLAGAHYGLGGNSVPSIATVHDYYFRRPTVENVSDLRRMAIEGYSIYHNLEIAPQLRRCAALVSISETTRDHLQSALGLDSVVIHHWVDTDLFRPRDRDRARAELGLPPDATLLLNVGSSSVNKNRRVLGEIVDRLPAHFQIVKVGAPPVRPHPRVTHLGYLDEPRYALAFNAADAYLHTSSYEGFGRPVLEAAASGLPVIATDAPATPEVMGESAEYVRPPFTPSRFADAIRRATAESRREELGRLSLERARRFDPGRARDAYLALYTRVVGS